MWQYFCFKFSVVVLSRLPKWAGYFVATSVAIGVYFLLPSLNARIVDNLRHVLGPETSKAEFKRIHREILRNAARNYFDLVHLPHMKASEIESSMSISGQAHFDAALKRGKGVIIITAHLGSFEMAAQWIAVTGIKGLIPVEPLEPDMLLDLVCRLRNCKGLNCVPARTGVLKPMMQALRRGEVVLMPCDRDLSKGGYRASFFGEETTFPVGAVRLAMHTGAALVPAFGLRRGHGRYTICFEPEIEVVPGRNGAVPQTLRGILAVFEDYIRRYPEQWVVLNRIWQAKEPAGQVSALGRDRL